jgi:rod shape-determining protein MreC
VYKNCLVGRVSQVFPHYSRVDLITDKQCKVAAQTGNGKYKGIHEGLYTTDTSHVIHLYDNTLELENKIKTGDVIISSGDGLLFPRGFALGRVATITRNDFNCTLILEPLIDFKTLEYCSVLMEDSSSPS